MSLSFLFTRTNYFDKAAKASSLPPVTVLPANEAVGTALDKSADLICAALEPGFTEAYKAAAPVTCGVAIEVPL